MRICRSAAGRQRRFLHSQTMFNESYRIKILIPTPQQIVYTDLNAFVMSNRKYWAWRGYALVNYQIHLFNDKKCYIHLIFENSIFLFFWREIFNHILSSCITKTTTTNEVCMLVGCECTTSLYKKRCCYNEWWSKPSRHKPQLNKSNAK